MMIITINKNICIEQQLDTYLNFVFNLVEYAALCAEIFVSIKIVGRERKDKDFNIYFC